MGSNGANLIAYAALTALLMLVAGGSQAAPMECHFDSRGERNHDPKLAVSTRGCVIRM